MSASLPGPAPERRQGRRQQRSELLTLVALYLLQVGNAEMLRRATAGGHGGDSLMIQAAFLLANRIHPVAMVVVGSWLALLGLALLRGCRLPRWAFDAPGLWFCLRLALEFLTINGLIFTKTGQVSSAVLLGQIVLYLPYFVLAWGWIFQRVDLVAGDAPGRMVLLADADPSRGISAFDYHHSSVTTLLNRSKPTISGVSRRGRVLVLIHQLMLTALYAVAFARILQLTRAVI